jgi:hypothetical protein
MSEESPEIGATVNNKLKSIDVNTLETAIAKAISELLGAEYKCEVNDISYTDNYLSDSAKFRVNVWKNIWRNSL